ncbi:alpha/beta fold hydrolase [Streptomyces buecherae]|uniref:Alpha/beta fold hydrolase n=1 Tax=Streptomyces buecherae TaxID=2763006 RepID=A0A7H8N5Z6_9ACTN|nr:alpha/beta fold hydrolase [Streptomyces buecherae]QKW49924.1 alpha/beta fold hydrolase [Streptomyces buecherae]
MDRDHDVPSSVVEHRIQVGDISTHYFESGSGPAILLLHGAGGNAGYWLRQIEELGKTHRAIAVDLPGYGETESLGRDDPAQTASFLWRFADAIDLSRPVLIGHSLGGLLAVLMSLEKPQQVTSVVMVAAAGMGRAINPMTVLQARTPLGDLTPWLARLPGGPQLLVTAMGVVGTCAPWRLPRSWWRYQVETASTYEALVTTLQSFRSSTTWLGQKQVLLDRLHELPMPTLVMWGAHDRMVPFWQGVAAARRLPRGRLRLLPCSGHLLPNESDATFMRELRLFLREADVPGGEEASPGREGASQSADIP